ncbi:MAG: STAS domain-containing protein [Anaerohalosphaeraceae bacterium]|nr:STAS domain-containing protein [Anaerohalosphaeraceae bacterium]
MGIQDWSDDIIMVNLVAEPQLGEELKAVSSIIRQRKNCGLVIDFAEVEIVTSSSLAQLLRLQKLTADNGQRMILCSLSKRTMGIFDVTGLEQAFDFAEEAFSALASMQMVH